MIVSWSLFSLSAPPSQPCPDGLLGDGTDLQAGTLAVIAQEFVDVGMHVDGFSFGHFKFVGLMYFRSIAEC